MNSICVLRIIWRKSLYPKEPSMHCATCGAHLYHLDVLFGNCVITASGYAHVRTHSCDAAKLRRERTTRRRKAMRSPLDRPHNQAEHINTKTRVRVTPLITPPITPRIVLPVTPTTVVPHAGKPTMAVSVADEPAAGLRCLWRWRYRWLPWIPRRSIKATHCNWCMRLYRGDVLDALWWPRVL